MPMRRSGMNATFYDAQIIWPNFSGEEKRYNRAGDRYFNIELDEILADDLRSKGWNVKQQTRTDDDGITTSRYVLQVSVSFKFRPPRIWLITSGGRTMLGEGMVSILDMVDYTKVDVSINGSHWNVGGNSGVKAYLESGFFTMYESELEKSYADVPTLGTVGDSVMPELTAGVNTNFDAEGEVV